MGVNQWEVATARTGLKQEDPIGDLEPMKVCCHGELPLKEGECPLKRLPLMLPLEPKADRGMGIKVGLPLGH